MPVVQPLLGAQPESSGDKKLRRFKSGVAWVLGAVVLAVIVIGTILVLRHGGLI